MGGALGALDGIGVLVTRPVEQAEDLCRQIEDKGGRAIRCPVVEIREPQDSASMLRAAEHFNGYDMVIFVSRNAVRCMMPMVMTSEASPLRPRIAAVGEGTARELSRFGITVSTRPTQRFDSEGLLATQDCQAIAGKRVLLVRGEGGRELLAKVLTERGAILEHAVVYRRSMPDVDVASVHRSLERGEIDIVTATSSESLRNLFAIVGQRWVRRVQLVVIGERTYQLALELGVDSPPLLAAAASDEALCAAMVSWAAGRA